MSKYIVEMPEGWEYSDDCSGCPFQNGNCKISGRMCPLAKAKEVVEVGTELTYYNRSHSNGRVYEINGKPVKLYAAKEDK